MEEADDEIHSQPPPSPPGDGGRIAVMVASTPPLTPPSQLPRPSPPPSQPTTTTHKAGGGGGGREDCWSEGATGFLIDAWGERYLELSRGNLKQKHWKEVAEIVSSRDNHSKTPKTDIQCKNRIDTVKKKYKLEKGRIATGGAASKWVFFDKLDGLIGSTAKMSKIPIGIPVRVSINANLNASNQSFDRKNRTVQLQIHKRRPQPVTAGLEMEEGEGKDAAGSPESADSLPRLPPPPPVKKRRTAVEAEVGEEKEVRERGKWRRRRRRRSDGVRELTQAILRFGEMYEKLESAKLMQMVEMEKQRMKFEKELELQRTQFFVKTQLELSQLKVKGTRRRRRKRRGGGNSNGNQFHSCNDDVDNDTNDVNDNNSDSSS